MSRGISAESVRRTDSERRLVPGRGVGRHLHVAHRVDVEQEKAHRVRVGIHGDESIATGNSKHRTFFEVVRARAPNEFSGYYVERAVPATGFLRRATDEARSADE